MRSQSPKFSKEQDGQIQGHLLCQAQPMAADSPAQPPGQPQNRGKLPGMFSLDAVAPSHLALGGSISSALPGENNPNLVLLRSAGA